MVDPTPGWDAPLVLKIKLGAKAKKSKKSTAGRVSIPVNKPLLQIES